MKKLIIVSDTHGSTKGLDSIMQQISENDILVHLGDGAGDVRNVSGLYPEKVYVCAGNCDFFSPLPSDGELEVEGLKLYYCHGHKYGVKSSLTALAKEAKARDCDIVLYGHTHDAKITEIDGITFINPGTFRNSTSKGGSYCYLVLHKGKATPVLVGESV